MKIAIYEFKKFFKKYFKITLIISIVLGIVLTGLSLFLKRGNLTEEIERNTDFANENGDAVISIYVEEQDGDQFSNTAILEQYIRSEKVISNIAEATNTNIDELVEEDIELSKMTGNTDNRVITTNKNNYSGMMEIIVSTGDENINSTVAAYIINNLETEIPFMKGKNIYQIGENPQIIENNDDTIQINTAKPGVSSILIRFLSSLLLSILVLSVMFSLYEFVSKKITFIYTIGRNINDDILLIDDNGFNNYLLKPYLNANNFSNTYILTEPLSDVNVPEELKNFKIFNDVTELPDINYTDEIIILVFSGKTSRNWYKSVKEFFGIIDCKIKIIQIN